MARLTYLTNEKITAIAAKRKYIKSYEDRDFKAWLDQTLDQIIEKNTVEQLTLMFHEDRS